MNLSDIHRIYFIGIGGIGMSALARFFHLQGAEVYGYDRTESDLCKELAMEGMWIHYEDDPSLIPGDVDLVVWTPAVSKDHQELNWFIEHGYPIKKRAEVLGIISKGKRCIAIAGTHGKTTTTTMAAYLLRTCGVDASAFLGGISANFRSNFVEGTEDWVVAEADEYDRSFLQLYPEIAVINSIDPDHLDIYGTEEAVVASYEQFIRQIKPGGTLLYKHGLPLDAIAEELRASGRKVFTFGIDQGDFEAYNVQVENGQMAFGLRSSIMHWDELRLNYPGKHNVENATAAIAVTLLAGGFTPSLPDALAGFRGVKRRFEFIFRSPDQVYIDDYAHHPAELEAVIGAAKMLFPDRKVTGIFQPHLYSRTRDFAEGFAAALDRLDEVILLDIYPAREQPIPGVTSSLIFDKMKQTKKILLVKTALMNYLNEHPASILLTMGAGDIDTYIAPIKRLFEAKNN
ncbi:MAG: UDP-N-acetylmuramate--L-alanine ligase [Saprospiraceae bacterium]|nr:UDP-N-acetylmuramate--L-alanine ligase [Saprospiraceae bacterium]